MSFNKIEYSFTEQKKGGSERGTLLEYFAERMNMGIPRMAFHLKHLGVQDMYYLKSICETGERDGHPFGKIFWYSIRAPKK